MSWEGANILQRQQQRGKKKKRRSSTASLSSAPFYGQTLDQQQQQQPSSPYHHQQHHDNTNNTAAAAATRHGGRHRHHRRRRQASSASNVSSETVEAALNRLSKAYTVAMECVGAWHQAAAAAATTTTTATTPDNNDQDQHYELSLKQVAQTTRQTWERAILLDPLILQYAPVLDQLLTDWCSTSSTSSASNASTTSTSLMIRHARGRHYRPLPATLTSAGHQATVQQLAYLSLVNYADLLLAGCTCASTDGDGSSNSSANSSSSSILDRGVVRPVLQGSSCWEMETNDTTTTITTAAAAAAATTTTATTTLTTTTRKEQEAEVGTVRLALVCYMDATELDGSDPTTWLKLACAARRLGRLLVKNHKSSVGNNNTWHNYRYRRLERHALERGQVCLPSHVPPNRTIVRAYQQWLDEPWTDDDPSGQPPGGSCGTVVSTVSTTTPSPPPPEPSSSRMTLTLELPRYSWAVLGRMLLRACREGNHYYSHHAHSTAQTLTTGTGAATNDSSWLFASPLVVLQLSPMLTLPPVVLHCTCSFLDAASIRRLESTCRALSVSVLAARRMKMTTLEKTNAAIATGTTNNNDTATAPIPASATNENNKDNDDSINPATVRATASMTTAGSGGAAATSLEGNVDGGSAGGTAAAKRASPAKSSSPRHANHDKQASRTSKRLRSQIITSGKRAERSSRRTSTDYCLLAATMGCTPDDANYLVQRHGDPVAGRQRQEQEPKETDSAVRSTSTTTTTNDSAQLVVKKLQQEAGERLSPASLTLFVQKWSNNSRNDSRNNNNNNNSSNENSPPLVLLFGFCAHASVYISQVYASDYHYHGSVVLSSCLYDCLDLLVKRTRTYSQGLSAVSWSMGEFDTTGTGSVGAAGGTGGLLGPMELFALDLLHAELRLKKCDRADQVDLDFDSDGNVVGMLVPRLLSLMDELDQMEEAESRRDEWIGLKARCYWLAAGFYFWRGRLCSIVSESRAAEKEGLRFIDMIRSILNDATAATNGSRTRRSTTVIVPTPHLEGIGRAGLHWKELSNASLFAFQNEIQASSVVLRAREQFLDAASKLKVVESIVDDDEEDSTLLFPTLEEGASFTSIGKALLKRYQSPVESPDAHHSELIDDFLSSHGTAMLSYSLDADPNKLLSWFETLVQLEPLESKILRQIAYPCTLTILVACLVIDEKGYDQVLSVLVNSARTIRRMQQRQLAFATERQAADEADLSNDGLSDDMSLMSDNDGSTGQAEQLPGDRSSTMRLYARLFWLLINSICRLINEKLNEQERNDFSATPAFHGLVQDVYDFCEDWKGVSAPNFAPTAEVTEDLYLLQSTGALATSFYLCASEALQREMLDRLNLLGLVRVMVQQQRNLKELLSGYSGQKGGHPKRRQMNERANVLAVACCEVGRLLSRNLAQVDAGRMRRSRVWDEAQHALAPLCGCLLWLWHVTAAGSSEGNVMRLEPQCSRSLRIPVAIAIVGVCGSAALTQKKTVTVLDDVGHEKTNDISLVDFFDSDDSATEWLSDDDGGDISSPKHEDLLRVTSQAVHCVHGIVGTITADEITQQQVTEKGPLLPLVMARVLNFFADILLTHFVGESTDEDDKGGLWADYSFGTRAAGTILDSLLYRAYRAIYGFNLVSADSSGHHSADDAETPRRRPESVAAAAQLYRCFMRACGHGRKSPPKAAIETVLSALPPAEESKRSTTIRMFLFTTESSYFDYKSMLSVATKSSKWRNNFSALDEWDWETWEEDSRPDAQTESVAVRRGLSRLVAQGPMPAYQEGSGAKNPRKQTSQVEFELSRKFESILYELSFGDIEDCEGWCKLAECCFAKSELVADRLGLANGYSQADNFYVKDRPSLPKKSLAIAELLSEQEKQTNFRDVGWIRMLGGDLSVYMEYIWASFESLKACHRKVASDYRGGPATNDPTDDARAWREIDRYLDNQEFASWQQAWGGLFVSCLRTVGIRCMCLSLYILYKRIDSGRYKGNSDKLLVAQIRESLGTWTYSHLVGGHVYGYPIVSMTPSQKREIAEASLACFLSCTSVEEGKDTERGDWDILFMVGKCHEKIAKTYQDEKFSISADGSASVRLFEHHGAKALEAYAASFAKAEKLEKKGDLILDQQGGSSHGSAEALYRLHASRLKYLIAAVDRSEAERTLAELEALRLTEAHFFSKADTGPEPSSVASVRDRVWRVVVDVVEAFIHCRKQHSFFHRSVYRHAQALMWAPVLSDPSSRAEGSFATVAATHAFKLRGLNSDSAVESAASVINSLFEKKRTQLCAVWVTSVANPSPLQQINISVRKYDMLRGKYIKAYVESMRLCNRRNDLEQFLRAVNLCPRDLPCYFEASAKCQGGIPAKALHTSDCLLVKSRSLSSHHFITAVKRQANAALAEVILHEIKSGKTSGGAENQIKLTYSCFLRLNCEPSALLKRRNRMSSGVKPIVDALVALYPKLPAAATAARQRKPPGKSSDWSVDGQTAELVKTVLDTCKELFPSLSGSFLTKKTTSKPKKKSDAVNNTSDNQQRPGEAAGGGGTAHKGKRKEPDGSYTELKQFSVTIPEGLKPGDTFLTQIQTGEKISRVRLTVPETSATSLRFALRVPMLLSGAAEKDHDAQHEPATKKKRRGSGGSSGDGSEET